MPNSKSPTIALVYDRVNTPHGGAERVLLALHEIYPDAPLYTSVYDADTAKWASVFQIHTSFLQNIPGIKNLHRQFLALMPLAFSRLDLTAYDIVISMTSAEAKAVRVNPSALHLCYLLTPPRYIWSHPYEYQTGILKIFKIAVTHLLRKWDYQVAQKPTVMIPISSLVRQRALKYYRRAIEQPLLPTTTFIDQIDQDQLTTSTLTSPYFLIVSRLVSYKRIDLAIQATLRQKKSLIIIGKGPDSARLRALIPAGNSSIQFISETSDQELLGYYTHAEALLVPAEEDFGITVLEAQRCGTPVILYQHVGAIDLIKESQTAIVFHEQTIEALSQAMEKHEKKTWDRSLIQEHAKTYTTRSFQQEFADRIKKLWYSHSVKDRN